MQILARIKTVAKWALCAATIFLAGSFLGFYGLRWRGLRHQRDPSDWIDASVGIFVILAVACALLAIRLRIASSARRAAVQLYAAAGEPRGNQPQERKPSRAARDSATETLG